MKRIIAYTFLSIITIFPLKGAYSQIDKNFINDLNKSVAKDFSKHDLTEMFKKYPHYLTAFSEATHLAASFKGQTISEYPLSELKQEKFYPKTIKKLLKSKNENHRLLSYLVIAAANDKSKEKILLNRLPTEEKNVSAWLAFSLLYLKCSNTTQLFDYFTTTGIDAALTALPLFNRLNQDSLQQTAVNRIFSNNVYAQIGAAHLMTLTPRTDASEQLLRQAVKIWPWNIKGYAVNAMRYQGIGNLKQDLAPLLDSVLTAQVAMEALADSPSEEDQLFLKNMADASPKISKELLDAFYLSKKVENVVYWLQLLRVKQLPKKYYFSVSRQPLLFSDECLPELQNSFGKITDVSVLSELVRALKNRSDPKSESIFIALLRHENSGVRQWTARTLNSVELTDALQKEVVNSFLDKNKRTSPLVENLIRYNVDTLHDEFENIYLNSEDFIWRNFAIQYLASFPLPKHRDIFRNILADPNEELYTQKRYSALGLARLGDDASVNLIIDACNQEALKSDINCIEYLNALGIIKGDAAKETVRRFVNSKEAYVSKIANSILANW